MYILHDNAIESVLLSHGGSLSFNIYNLFFFLLKNVIMFFNLLMLEILNHFNLKNIRIFNNSTSAV